MPYLVDLSSDKSIAIGNVTTIGRDPGCDVVLTDPLVSRKHAVVRRSSQGEFVLLDMGSTHGTFVEGRKIDCVELKDGVEVRLGGTTLKLCEKVKKSSGFRTQSEISDNVVLRHDYERLRAAYELTRAVGVEHDVQKVLHRVLDTAFELVAAERGVIQLVCAPEHKIARTREGASDEIDISQTILAEVQKTKRGVISADAGTDARFSRSESIFDGGVRSAMCVPLLYEEEVLGAIHVDSLSATNVFVEKDLELFAAIASQASLAIRNAMMREELLSAREEEIRRLTLLLEHLPIGVMLLDEEQRVVTSNPAARSLVDTLGLPKERIERIGEQTLEELMTRCSQGPTDIRMGDRWVELCAGLLSSSPQEGVVVAMRDVTERRARAKRAAHEQRIALMGQLASGVAHDFNNVLGVILGCAEMLLEDLEETPMHRDAELLYQAAQSGAKLTQRLLAFSRKGPVKPSLMRPDDAVRGLCGMLERAVGTKVHLSADIEETPKVYMDKGQLDQVLMNLVVNAKDAMPEGGEVFVRTSAFLAERSTELGARVLEAGRYAKIEVEDTGTGIPKEVVERIFEPYFTTKAEGKGTGLGLATVQGIAEQAGGILNLKSTGSSGTVFELYLPSATDVATLDIRTSSPAQSDLRAKSA